MATTAARRGREGGQRIRDQCGNHRPNPVHPDWNEHAKLIEREVDQGLDLTHRMIVYCLIAQSSG